MGGGCAPLGKGAGSPSNNVARAEAYVLYVKFHFDPCSRLPTVDIGRKLGAVPPFWGGEAGSPSIVNSVAWVEAYLHTKCHLDPCSRFATIDMGQQIGGCSVM